MDWVKSHGLEGTYQRCNNQCYQHRLRNRRCPRNREFFSSTIFSQKITEKIGVILSRDIADFFEVIFSRYIADFFLIYPEIFPIFSKAEIEYFCIFLSLPIYCRCLPMCCRDIPKRCFLDPTDFFATPMFATLLLTVCPRFRDHSVHTPDSLVTIVLTWPHGD